ncbi:MAG TPA: gluconate 2-dehydrogenase subunit 3 family protein [Steroidobacteraceae bacterium]|nr:gluconate 2-dehydrogenase subunit 3 family protein [Steroidobacteraceae bacterium]
MNRRSLLLGVVFLVGGAAALTRFTRRSAGNVDQGPVLSPDQFALLEQVTDVMIPPSDTPGAIAAGVPVFLRQMLTDWAAPETRAQIVAVLDRIDKQAWNRYGAAFVALPGERRLDVLRNVDAEGVASQDVAYGKFKWLVLAGYYQSEIGATQELRYELVPGAWRACLPLTEVGRASAV